MKKIRLKPNREISVLKRHQWIFSGGIESSVKDIKNGDLVEVFSSTNKFLAIGYFMDSDIAVRIITFVSEEIDVDFFERRFRKAFSYRRSLINLSETNNIFRLINGEGDGLPGLIVDVYGDIFVIQTHNGGIDCQIDKISAALELICKKTDIKDLLKIAKLQIVIKKANRSDAEAEETKAKPDDGGEFKTENGYQFYIDPKNGQKTGFFIDQRDNRQIIGNIAKNKTVLDAFCYAGGFSVYALGGGAKEVLSIDASRAAIAMTERNIIANFPVTNKHQSKAMDCFDFLEKPDREFDLIILDPPAFAKHRNAVERALRGYEMINSQAMKIIKPEGIIATFSCSQLITKQLFLETIARAMRRSNREVKLIKELGQAACHPVSPCHVEGEYLKGWLLWVG